MGSNAETSTALTFAMLMAYAPCAPATTGVMGIAASTYQPLDGTPLLRQKDDLELNGTARFLAPVPEMDSIASATTGEREIGSFASRVTTAAEEAIGELRAWRLYEADWDGEGSSPPNLRSLADAEHFVCAMGEGMSVPSPMLHPSGLAGLFWKDDSLYADLEFLGDGRVSYFIKRQGEGRHKGVVNLRQDEVPAVFATLLRS